MILKGEWGMADIGKKMEQLEKLRKQIEMEKEKVNLYLGKKLIQTLDLEYESLDKDIIDKLIDDIVMAYKEKFHIDTPKESADTQEITPQDEKTIQPSYTSSI